MENTKAASEQIALPVNYFWSTTDPALPFSGSAMGNPFIFPPSNATRVPTKESYPKGTYPCWDYKKNDWIPRPDYRQIPLWNKQTGVPEISSTIDCPPYLTDVPPTTNCPYESDVSPIKI